MNLVPPEPAPNAVLKCSVVKKDSKKKRITQKVSTRFDLGKLCFNIFSHINSRIHLKH